MSSSALPPHPFELFKQTYDAAAESWAKAMEQVISTDEFVSAAGAFMERYADFQEAMRKAAEASFEQLPVPSKEDVARLAQLVINVERKVDEVTDALFEVQDRLAAAKPAEAPPAPPSPEVIATAVRTRLEPDRLDADALVERVAARIEEALSGRLAALEARLEALASAPAPAAGPAATAEEPAAGAEPAPAPKPRARRTTRARKEG